MTTGDGNDTVTFKWQDPMIALAFQTGRAFTNLTDFDANKDRFVFDVAGLGSDATGANFIDGGNGTVGGQAASFFKGAAAASNGQSVMVLTDTGFATGANAVIAAKNEAMGDFVLYFNTTVNVGEPALRRRARHGAFDRPLRQHQLAGGSAGRRLRRRRLPLRLIGDTNPDPQNLPHPTPARARSERLSRRRNRNGAREPDAAVGPSRSRALRRWRSPR